MVVTQRLTPETFLSAPRRGPAIPNHNGSLALHTVSTHTFGKGTLKEVRVMDLRDGVTWQLSQDNKVHDANWIPGDETDVVLWLKDCDEGRTQLVVTGGTDMSQSGPEQYVAGEIEAPVKLMKLAQLDDGSVALAVVGQEGKDGKLFNEQTAEKSASTARVYDTPTFKQWNKYVSPNKYVIWYSKLQKIYGKWELAAPLRNLLLETNLEAPSRMLDMGDPSDRFDISPKGIAFIASNLKEIDPIYTSADDAYFVPLDDFTSASSYKPTRFTMQGGLGQGMAFNIRFSPDGAMIAFLWEPFADWAEARVWMAHIGSLVAFDVAKLVINKAVDLEIASFEFAPHSRSLYIIAEECARAVLYELELAHHAKPRLLLKNGSVSAAYSIVEETGNVQILTTSSSLVESSVYHLIDTSGEAEPRIVSAASRHGAKYGLSNSQVSEFWFEGGGDYCVQAWMVKPRDFDEKKKYPLALLVHGGPEGAWHDEWSGRWNSAVWAEQGFVVIQPNPTGSVGFGKSFRAGVYNNWGGRPYQDLVNCMDHLKKVPYLDHDRAVLAGASYGGYMVNWINGHPLAKRFKASVCHDGIFNVPTFVLQTDEAPGKHDFGGVNFPWANWEGLDKWNPGRPDLLKEWKHAPPCLVVHSDSDYRCPVGEGWAAFKALQSLGVHSRFLNFPNEGHFVVDPENALVWWREMLGWVEKWIGKPGGIEREQE